MNYPTNLLRAFAVVCSWRILKVKLYNTSEVYKAAVKSCLLIIFYSAKTGDGNSN